MPELPEVETVVRTLAPHVVGRRIVDLELYDELLVVPERKSLRGRRIKSIKRIAKLIVLELGVGKKKNQSRPLWLTFHLRMTGRLLWRPELDEEGDERHLRARLLFEAGLLAFKDVRRFGRIELTDDLSSIGYGGVDPLGSDFDATCLRELLGTSRQELKVWLLRQDRVSGIGNIYASEILYRAKLSPFREACSLDGKEVRKLRKATRDVLQAAVDARGTTLSVYVDSTGKPGSFQEKLAVYGRDDTPCPRCGDSLSKETQQGRSTFYCSRCQT